MSVRRDQFSGSSSLKNLKNRYHGSTSDLPSTINLGGESRVRPRRGSYPFPKSQQTAIRAISQLPPRQPTSNQLQRQWHVNAYDQRKTTSLVVRTPLAQQPRRIYFYHKTDPYYGFTNFSDHPVVFNGQRYPTSEHLFQSLKFTHRPKLAEHIRLGCPRPNDALSEARRFQPEVRTDWRDVNIEMMNLTLELKFQQHVQLREELINTGNAELIEDSDKDSFWGVGANRTGQNQLGIALMRLRSKLQENRAGAAR